MGMGGFQFEADQAEIASMICEAGTLIPLPGGRTGTTSCAGTQLRCDAMGGGLHLDGRPVRAIVDEDYSSFRLKAAPDLLAEIEGKAALFYFTDADFKRIPTGTPLLYRGINYYMSAETAISAGGRTLVHTVLCDGGLWPHRCDIYAPEWTVSGAGKPSATTFVLKAFDVPCFYDFTYNIDTPTGIGRVKSAGQFTRDNIHFPYDVEINNAWWIVDRTRVSGSNTGEPVRTAGAIHKVQGAPTYVHPSSIRLIGKQVVQGMTDDNPPATLLQVTGLKVL